MNTGNALKKRLVQTPFNVKLESKGNWDSWQGIYGQIQKNVAERLSRLKQSAKHNGTDGEALWRHVGFMLGNRWSVGP